MNDSIPVKALGTAWLWAVFTLLAAGMSCHAEAPANDARADALAIGEAQPVAGTLEEATAEEGETLPPGFERSVWYTWTATAAGLWEARITSSYGQLNLSVRESPATGPLREVTQSAFPRFEPGEGTPLSRGARFHTAAGARLFFQVYGNGTDAFTLTLRPHTGTPVEDKFTGATPLPAAVQGVSIPTAQSTLEPGEPRTWHEWQGSVWRTWTPPTDGWWMFHFGSGWGGVDVWRGASLESVASAVAASLQGDPEDGGDLLPSTRVVVRTTAGETLRVRILTDNDEPALLTVSPVSAGDMFAQPVELGAGENVSYTRRSSEPLTVERGEDPGSGGTQWLVWDCPATGIYELNGNAPWRQTGGGVWCTGYSPIVALYRGTSLATLSSVPLVPLGIVEAPLRFRATGGERLRIRTALSGMGACYTNLGNDGGMGGFPILGPSEITLTLKRVTPVPAHDDFASAADHASSADFTASGSNAGATNEPGETIGQYAAGDSVWHRWTAPVTGRYEFRVTSEALLEARIYRGTALDALVQVATGRGYIGQTPDGDVQLRFEAAEGTVHYIRMAGNGYGQQGAYSFRLRRMFPPANDMQAAATLLNSSVPVSAAGDTTFAGAESPLEYSAGSPFERTSSIWWRWSAPASGIYEVTAPASLGLMENGVRFSHTFDIARERLRFQAVAGRVYHLRAAHTWSTEGPVTLTLDRVAGLEHTTAETALNAGSSLNFSTPLTPVAPGPWYALNAQSSGALWVRWTPATGGWVSVDTIGSTDPGGLAVYEAAFMNQSLAVAGDPTGGTTMEHSPADGTFSFLDEVPRGFLSNRVLVDRTLAPAASRLLVEVIAGRTYYIAATPSPENALTDMMINARPAGAAPAVTASHVRVTSDAGVQTLTATVSVTSPNGFTHGQVQVQHAGTAGFTDAQRISGNAFAGDYQIVLPFIVPAIPDLVTPAITLCDAAGGTSISTGPPTSQEMPFPIDLATPDTEGPRLDGIVSSPARVVLNGADVIVSMELGISDGGGSGFAEGDIMTTFASGWNHGAPPVNLVRFGPAQRIRGDAGVGVYAVTITIPAAHTSGALWCHLRDAAGNFAGTWNNNTASLFPDGGAARSLTIPYFTPAVRLPLDIEPRRPVDETPVLFRETAADFLTTSGEVRLRGRITHPAGITGGAVTLADQHGVVETSVAFTAAARVSGTAQDGTYEFRFPVPARGFGGTHWLAWQAFSGAGGAGMEKLIGPVELPDRTGADTRRPRLTRFQISPAAVNLLAGAANITVTLAAGDDHPNIIARVRILDSDARELASRLFPCADCTETLTLPRVLTTGPSAAARIIVELTDASGRREVYGEPWSPEWPDALAASLTLAPSVPDTFTRWSAAWPGLAGLPASDSRNTDGDAWPDLLEFAYGTDPSAPEHFDPFAGRLPRLTVLPGTVNYPGSDEVLSQWKFTPAPWFEWNADTFRCESWELAAQESSDLQTWLALPLPGRAGNNEGSSNNDPSVRVNAIHPATEPYHWFRAVVRRIE